MMIKLEESSTTIVPGDGDAKTSEEKVSTTSEKSSSEAKASEST
jgi:hypothetical protein